MKDQIRFHKTVFGNDLRLIFAVIFLVIIIPTNTISSDNPDDLSKNITLNRARRDINTAEFGILYASTGHTDGGRLTIDPNTGSGTLVGPTGISAVPGLAINSKGEIFAIEADNCEMYRIDAATGAAIFVANTDLDFLPAIAFDCNDILYGLGRDHIVYQWNLYTIDTNTGVPSMIGSANSGGSWRGMAFNPIDGTLWASTSGQDIYIINPTNGTSILIGTSGLSTGMPDIQFDDDGILYGVSGGDGLISNLVIIDQTTAVGTLIGVIGFSSVSGMAYPHQKLEGPQIGIFPLSVNFNKVIVGSDDALQTILIRSIGTDTLTVSAISTPVSPFGLGNVPSLPVMVPPGETASFDVSFVPIAGDKFNTTITISSDDSNNNSKDITLNGEGMIINPAEFSNFYASTGHNNGGQLITIDPNNGSGTLVGPTGLGVVPGLAINSNGDIFAIEGVKYGLYRIDAATGASIFIGNTNLDFLPAIAFDGSDILYGLGMEPLIYEWNLYAINTTTGVPTAVGPATSGGSWRGMAFNPIDGNLWASTNYQDIYIINPTNGTPILMGSTGLSTGMPDIQFDDDGILYGATGGGTQISNLVTIDETTAAGTLIGSIGFPSVSGMASRHKKLEGPQIGIFPLNVNFNEVIVGSNDTSQTIIIRSIGTDTLTVSAISVPGLPFSLSKMPSLPAIIRPGGIDSVIITFSPSSVDTFKASITISSNDPDNASKLISLGGEGIISDFAGDIYLAGYPKSFRLHQNYPNPFNPITSIRYEIPITGPVSLKMYDVLGREVITLVNEVKTAGRYTVQWDAFGVTSGVYLYRLQAGSFDATRKVILIK